MKVLHTSDWHIGHVLYNWDRNDEHQVFFDRLAAVVAEEQPDAMVVSGDIFHTSAPSVSARKMYIENMLRIHEAAPGMTVVVTAGNHDSGSGIETDRSLWEHFSIHAVGSVARGNSSDDLDRHIIPVGKPVRGYIAAMPHCYPQNFPAMSEDMPRHERPAAFFRSLLERTAEINKENLPVVLMAHATVIGSDPRKQDIIVGGLDSINISELGDGFDYLALGHIHFPQSVGRSARYCGSPIPVSFNEDYPHGITVVELEGCGTLPEIRTVDVPVLRPVVTLPEGEAVDFESALSMLEAFPEDKEAYVRLNVKVKQYGGADWSARAMAATQGKKCRYCYIWMHSSQEADAGRERADLSREELHEKNPLDIAMMHWEDVNGEVMDAELEKKLRSVIEEKVGK